MALLTGMGVDGASEIAALKTDGAYTIVQDEETSVVFGMPKAAIELGGASTVLALHEIPSSIMAKLST